MIIDEFGHSVSVETNGAKTLELRRDLMHG